MVSLAHLANGHGQAVVIETQPTEFDVPAVGPTNNSYRFADAFEETRNRRFERLVGEILDLPIRLSTVITQIAARHVRVDVATRITWQTWKCNHIMTPTELFGQSSPRLVWIPVSIAATEMGSLKISHLGSRPPLKKLTMRRSSSLCAARRASADKQFLGLEEAILA